MRMLSDLEEEEEAPKIFLMPAKTLPRPNRGARVCFVVKPARLLSSEE
jgi:hypothetical protein